MPKLQFWYEFASTYSYLAAMRIEALAEAAGVTVEWKPFLLGPVFRAQGLDNSPFNIYPVKGRYMLRDLERTCAGRGLPPFRLPEPFPQNSLYAARLALIGAEEGWCAGFSRELFQREFGEGASLTDKTALADALQASGERGDQGAVEDADGRGPGTRDFRRAIIHYRGWRIVLGRRPA